MDHVVGLRLRRGHAASKAHAMAHFNAAGSEAGDTQRVLTTGNRAAFRP